MNTINKDVGLVLVQILAFICRYSTGIHIGMVFGIDIDIDSSHLYIEVEEEVASQVGQEEEGKHHLLLQ